MTTPETNGPGTPEDPPTRRLPTQPSVSTAPPSGPRRWWSRVPHHLGRARTSTVVLALLFVGLYTLYLYVRPPDPAVGTTPATDPSVTTPATTAPAEPTETTPPAETSEPAPTSAEQEPTTTAPSPTEETTEPAPTSVQEEPTTQAPDTAGPTATGAPGS